jgi:sigma-B regulation protein RsbU (phosphoserine phosphatase)
MTLAEDINYSERILPGADDPLRCAAYDLGDEYEVANAEVPAKPPSSGDFHAAFPLEDGTVALVMGDVVGHGEAAGEHAGALCRAIGECLIEGLPPAEALGFVNAAAEMSPEFEGFATVFAGKVEKLTGTLTYASGGHEPALVAEPDAEKVRKGNKEAIRELDSTGPPLGVMGAEEVRYEERTVTIEGGSTLLLYTDGVTEARRGREMLGTERLRGVLARWLFLRPLPLVCKIVGFARAFTGQGRKLRDDAALLALRRRRLPQPKM